MTKQITPLQLLSISRTFDQNVSYKELIRAFKKEFDVQLTKAEAKELLTSRSWNKVFEKLTGETIDLANEDDVIRPIEPEKYELLEAMLKCSVEMGHEFESDVNEFLGHEYYIDEHVHYFNFPLYGEIITYKRKEPFLKCFLFDINSKGRRTINKIEDVPVSSDLPYFLLSIIKTINRTPILTSDKQRTIDNPIDYIHTEQPHSQRTDIMQSALFIKYGFKNN